MKVILLFGLAIIIANVTFAQHAEFGLKAGVNFANLRSNEVNIGDSKTGIHLGGLAHIHLRKPFALQPELVYSGQGAEYNNGTETQLQYLNMPVLVQYMFGEGFRLQTGPQLGLLVGAQNENGNTESNVKDNFKKGDFSWSFGAGYLSSTGLGVDARYNLGINNINKNTPDISNRVWQVGLFYQFRR